MALYITHEAELEGMTVPSADVVRLSTAMARVALGAPLEVRRDALLMGLAMLMAGPGKAPEEAAAMLEEAVADLRKLVPTACRLRDLSAGVG